MSGSAGVQLGAHRAFGLGKLVLGAGVAWALIGCVGPTASPLRFRAVDAETQKPLGGVMVHQTSERGNIMPPAGRNYTVKYHPSNAEGLIVTRPLFREFDNRFTFSKTGYLDSTVVVGDDLVLVQTPLPATTQSSKSEQRVPRGGDSLVTVPMYRASAVPGPTSTPATQASKRHPS